MFKGLGNIASLLKQAQTMGPRMEEASKELQAKRVTGTSGGGMVTVHADGLGQVIKIDVDPMLIEKGDVEMVKDLLPAAINQAAAAAKQLHVESMKSITGDLPLPGGLDSMLEKFTGQLGEMEPGDHDEQDSND